MAFSRYFLFLLQAAASIAALQQTRCNPALTGWHSDPSCVTVPDWNHTTFCTASTFLLTPGLPVYASKDLTNWGLASHAVTRKSQVPEYDESLTQNDGIWAATIRYHEGTFYIIVIYNDNALANRVGMIFTSTNPYDDAAWADPIRYEPLEIDPDIFWDDDGQAYVTSAGIILQTLDLETGAFGPARHIWNGTGGGFLEGPHIYKKDGMYYLLAAEGGSGVNHTIVVSRAADIWGPYESFEGNPVLTNRGTDDLFQNIGHGDLFQDARGQWWSSALAWRSGPEGVSYPMGREMVVTPVTWDDGEWPVFAPVRGQQDAWRLPEVKDMGGADMVPLVNEPDVVDFAPGSSLPRHFGFWRWPVQGSYVVSPPGHPGTLQLTPSPASVTDGVFNYTKGYDVVNRTLVMRRQTDTLFQYSVDVVFAPELPGEEAGVTLFLNQVQNLNLGIVLLPAGNETLLNPVAAHSSSGKLAFRFLASGVPAAADQVPAPVTKYVPSAWIPHPIRLSIRAVNETHYSFYAASSLQPDAVVLVGTAPATVVSGGDGPFTGSLVGAYATTNGGNGTTKPYLSRWRYYGLGQAIGNGDIVGS